MENDKKKTLAPTKEATKTTAKVAPKAAPTKTAVKKEKEVIFEENEQSVSITPEQHAQTMKLLQDLQAKVDRMEAEKSAKTEIANETEKNLEDDYLETPATFFSYSSKYGIYGDKRRGKIIGTPNNEGIKFDAYYRYNKKNAGKRGTDTVSISRAVIRSKSEAEWLRNHSQFGIKFFESIRTALDANVFLAEKMVQVSNMVSGLGDMQVIQRAKSEGITIIDPDISNVRQQLIKKIATKQINSERQAVEAKAKTLGIVEDKKIDKRAEAGDTGSNVY